MIRATSKTSIHPRRMMRSSFTALAVSFLTTKSLFSYSGASWRVESAFVIPRTPSSWSASSTENRRCYATIDPSTPTSTTASFHNLPRIYTGGHSLSPKAIIPLDSGQANYLTVMRITNPKRWGNLVGNIRIFNGKDGEWLAKVLVGDIGGGTGNTNKRRRGGGGGGGGDDMVVECQQLLHPQPEEMTRTSISLYMGRLKKTRRKWILEKVTELGVNRIVAVDTEFSSTDGWEEEKHRLQVIEASEQCERMTIPSLHEVSWDDLMDDIHTSNDVDWLICRERSPESRPLFQVLPTTRSTNILIGPEGGWSPRELKELQIHTHRDNVQFVSLGSTVLRAETAAIGAVSTIAFAQHVQDT